MKKQILLCTLLMFYLIAPTTAQNNEIPKPHEMRVSIGGNLGIGDGRSLIAYDYYGDNYSFGQYYHGDLMGTPKINLTYYYQLKKWFAIGVIADYYSTWQSNYSMVDDELTKKDRWRVFSIVPTVRFNWLNSKVVGLYSSAGLGLGYRIHTDIDKEVNITYKSRSLILAGEFIPFGITVGKTAFGFFEMGASNIGFVKIGFGYRFKD